MSGSINAGRAAAGKLPFLPRRVVISYYVGDQREYELEIKDLSKVETHISNHPERDSTVSWDDLERWLIRSGVVTIRWER